MSKKIPYQVTDPAALKAAYPELYTPEVITRDVRNKELTYEIVKMNFKLGRDTPGVTLRDHPKPEEKKPEEKETSAHLRNGGIQY